MPHMLFQGWEAIWRTIVVGALAYTGLVIFLRISGKRTLAKLNAFDLVVTVALGSTLSSILLQSSVALAEGLTAFALLILLQFIVTWSSVRWGGFASLVRSEPSLLLRDGAPIRAALRRQRITEGELMQAIRSSGGNSLADAQAVILESDGSISTILTD